MGRRERTGIGKGGNERGSEIRNGRREREIERIFGNSHHGGF